MPITITPSRRVVRIGDDVELDCEVSGVPQASVSWSRVGTSLPSNAQSVGNRLRLFNVQSNYGGVYQCKVMTFNGVFEENYPLAIQGKCFSPCIELNQFVN